MRQYVTRIVSHCYQHFSFKSLYIAREVLQNETLTENNFLITINTKQETCIKNRQKWAEA